MSFAVEGHSEWPRAGPGGLVPFFLGPTFLPEHGNLWIAGGASGSVYGSIYIYCYHTIDSVCWKARHGRLLPFCSPLFSYFPIFLECPKLI